MLSFMKTMMSEEPNGNFEDLMILFSYLMTIDGNIIFSNSLHYDLIQLMSLWTKFIQDSSHE